MLDKIVVAVIIANCVAGNQGQLVHRWMPAEGCPVPSRGFSSMRIWPCFRHQNRPRSSLSKTEVCYCSIGLSCVRVKPDFNVGTSSYVQRSRSQEFRSARARTSSVEWSTIGLRPNFTRSHTVRNHLVGSGWCQLQSTLNDMGSRATHYWTSPVSSLPILFRQDP